MILHESKNYILYNEYEVVFLKNKYTQLNIVVGDFYGDPICGIISRQETYCAIGGEGVVVYNIRLPFKPYIRNISSKQWLNFYRNIPEDTIWVENIYYLNEHEIMITTEDKKSLTINIRKEEEDF